MLLVEDEGFVREVVQMAIEDAGCAVTVARDGRDARSILDGADAAYQALVTDVAMGAGPSGWDVARRARELWPDIAVVYMTGGEAQDYAARGVPGSALLYKPFRPARIITLLSALLAPRSAPDRDALAIAQSEQQIRASQELLTRTAPLVDPARWSGRSDTRAPGA